MQDVIKKGGGQFVDRGDPAVADYSETGDRSVLNTDGLWHELDLSAIIPVGTIAVAMAIQISDDVIASSFFLRKKGNVNDQNRSATLTLVAGQPILGDVIVFCDTDRKIEYKGANVAFALITITVKGWWL